MKKVLTVLMIAVLAAGFVFADISGLARMDLKYNTANGQFGFVPTAQVNLKYALGESKTVAAQGDTYATVEADGQIYVQNNYADNNIVSPNAAGQWTFMANASDKYVSAYTIDLGLDVTAKIVSKNVVLTLKTASSNPVDLAKSAIDTYHAIRYDVWDQEILNCWDIKPVSLKSGFSAKAKWYGVQAEAFGAKFGLDLTGYASQKKCDFEVYGLTPVFAYNGLTAQAGFTVSNLVGATGDYDAKTTTGNTAGQISAKVGYTYDVFAASVAGDVVIAKTADGAKGDFDIAANVKYDFVTADIYYISAGKMTQAGGAGVTERGKGVAKAYKNYMSARVAADFTKFGAPVTFTVTAKNLLNGKDGVALSDNTQDARNFKFEAKYTGVVTADAWIAFCGSKNAQKVIEYNASVDYKFQNYCTFNVGIWGKKTKALTATSWSAQFMPTISATSTTLVPGATLSLGWYANTKAPYWETKTSNLLSAGADGWDCGTIRARVDVKF